ncbi:TPA: conserved phage C-terminal domain-containing protein [Enterobacter hormaechei subsp. steigerwaltii]|uniref:conserved phage C-terminal domain-containing protein n=1 Tax=Enterobacter hormaechei TaxID=158836 RepID=UPI000791ED8F|nr:conserved phage C-terminal domain-containing protein [Enterobacter hormaechei]HED1379049.1 conserved phage C-terminal domain-containing protein [Enterobacter hormaechei subsp. steigerwaltii]HED1968156.1 conserved phage C-terminal domain-containing protein [Enterobacter hormaechei subsp. hoffmannii]ELD7980748.1 conserved phage C-terminal domain-containing protein [Enterobacter hormaechei]SAB67851.1 PaaX family transcriptional regulator [Enterobacter hormaechei]VAF09092.1 Conserved phage C-te
MSLLMPSRPIVINPDLAYSIGLNEAIALQQVNYWLKETTSGLERDGVRWIYNTNEQWLEQFPFWSESTLKRTFTRLKNLGVLKVEQLNKSQRDMTNYYTINYESELLDEVKVTKSKSSKCTLPSGQNEPMEEVKVERSIGSKRTALIRSNCTDVLTENTTENTTDIKNPICQVAPQPDGDVLITDQAKQVLNHLNHVTSSRYQVSTTSLQNIRARIGEGFTVEELSLVVDYCNAKWSDDLTMAAYLRPQTLFQPTKFPAYLKSATNWANAGRPARVNGKWEREDGIFKSSFQNTDYSKIPDGFRGANK